MKPRSIKVNFFLNLVRTISAILFPLITFPYISRVLLSEGVGQANYVSSIISYFQLIASLGLITYAISEGSKIKNERELLNRFSTEIFIISIISMVVSYILFFLTISLPIFEPYRILLLVSASTIFFSTIGMEWLFSALEEYGYITLRSVLFQFISVALMFIFVKNSNDVLVYVLIITFANVGTGISNFVHRKKYIRFLSLSDRTLNLKKHIRPILSIFGSAVAVTIYLNSDITMLGLMKTDADVGIYVAAVKMIRIFCLVIGSLPVVVLPRVSQYINDKKMDEYNNLISKTANFMLLLIYPAIISVFILSKEIVLIFSGNGFADSILPLKILSLIIFLSPINSLLSNQVFVPNRMIKFTLFTAFSGALINVILNLILIPLYSSSGAAIATVVAESIVLVLAGIYAKDLVKFRMFFNESYKYILASLPIPIIYYFVTNSSIDSIYLRFLLISIFGFISYIACLIILRSSLSQEGLLIIKKKLNL